MNTTHLRFRSNNVRDIIALFHGELDPIYGDGEVSMFVRMLFEAFLGWDTTNLLINREETINQSDLLRMHWALEGLLQYRPIQHIIGWTSFCGCRIAVDKSTLIPRPETEEIVEKTIAMYGPKTPAHVLDLCTGSGCIAIALAKAWPKAEVTAVDIAATTLTKAQQNSKDNKVTINFVETDILKEEPTLPYPFDLIISNPPYVCESERAMMHRNVLDYEPATALFVPDSDPLLFYRRIAQMSRRLLSGDGRVVVETNERFAQDALVLFEKEGFTGNVAKDFRDKERMVTATRL